MLNNFTIVPWCVTLCLLLNPSLHLLNVVWDLFEVSVLHGILGCNPVGWVTLQQSLEQVETVIVKARHQLLERFLSELRHSVHEVFVVGELCEAGPIIRIRGAANLEYFTQLIFVILASKEGLSRDKRSENTADSPYVN